MVSAEAEADCVFLLVPEAVAKKIMPCQQRAL